MTNPEIIGGIGRTGLIHPGAADFAAFGGHQPFGPGFSRRSPLRDDMTVSKYGVDFRVAPMSRPGDRFRRLIICGNPVKAGRLKIPLLPFRVCRFRNQKGFGSRRKAAEFHPGNILIVHSVVTDVPAVVIRILEELSWFIPQLLYPVRSAVAGRTEKTLLRQVAPFGNQEPGPEPVSAGALHAVAVQGKTVAVVGGVLQHRKPLLLEIVFAGGGAGRLPHLIECGQQHGSENCDDRYFIDFRKYFFYVCLCQWRIGKGLMIPIDTMYNNIG